MITKQRLIPLLKRAAMSVLQWDTRMIYASDRTDHRVYVTSPQDNTWGDCIAIQTNNGDRVWYEAIVLSPARARVLAEQLILAAEQKEKIEDCKNIDRNY